MTNVLLIFGEEGPTAIETERCLRELEKKGLFQLKKTTPAKLNRNLFEWCDILYGIRSTESIERDIFKYARSKGIFVIELLDDDFLSLGSDYGNEGQGFWWGRKIVLKSVLRNIDCLVASNKNIVEKYGTIGNINRSYISNTPMDIDNFVMPSVKNGKIKIVYYVNDGTTDSFEKYIRPALSFIYKEMSDRVAFYFLALHPDMSEYEGKIEYYYVPHMSFHEFLQYLKDEKFDIGLAPLDDEGFSKYKYINKFVEYTRAGVAGIYSDCELYKNVIQDEYNGLLCNGNGESWGRAIKKLVDKPELRYNIALNAQQYAKENLSTEKVLKGIINGVPELAQYKAPAHSISKFRLFSVRLFYRLIFRPCGWVYTLFCCIKNGKSNLIIKRINRKIMKKG